MRPEPGLASDMSISTVTDKDLRIRIDPDSLRFRDTSELQDLELPWIGQYRAETAARFGLAMEQSSYNLFVLGEIGSGRSSLLLQAMHAAAAGRAVPPDMCFIHNFDQPELPQVLRLPAGQGRLLRQHMTRLSKTLQSEIPSHLKSQGYKTESERIKKTYEGQEAQAHAELDAYAESRGFTLRRDSGHLLFTFRDEKGKILTESELLALPKKRRAEIEQAERELHAAITRFVDMKRPLEQAMTDRLLSLKRQTIKPLLDQELKSIESSLGAPFQDSAKLRAYFNQASLSILDNLEAFQVTDDDEETRLDTLAQVLSRLQINLAVDNSQLTSAPVIVEDNPVFRSLFGGIEYQAENDILVTDFSRIRAGSLHKAHGGFILLHLRDLLADEWALEKLRRFLRSGRLQIEEPSLSLAPIAAVSLTPEPIEVTAKIVLIGTGEQFYDIQELDPEFARHFRVKVDFAESFVSTIDTRHATSVFVARTCKKLGLVHFSVAAVARLIEESHRTVDDQERQSAVFAQTEAWVIESAARCTFRGASLVAPEDVEEAMLARRQRHDYPEQCLQESISDGERLIAIAGERVGQLTGLALVDHGDYRFGFPVRVTAHTFAGEDGLLNIEREVEMSGPIHDKGVLVLHSYLSTLFAHIAPLALSASISFEQEYGGVEGDSASCAEFYTLISSLSGLPLKQGIAVTGAVNLHGEVLPVGGINEKIEGYFRTCSSEGLTGQQGVLIPHRNRRHLMLARNVVDAVSRGMFHVYTVDHVSEGLELLTGRPSGLVTKNGSYSTRSVLGLAQKTLQAYRRACQASQSDHKPQARPAG
jgi:predicted ATP-dependent protease